MRAEENLKHSLQQDSLLTDKIIIDSIRLSGNEITDNDIILKELPFAEGDTISLALLHYYEERIFSLGIFNKVKVHISSEDFLHYLNILVEESWYIYPLPFVDLKENDWAKISYGMNILIKNFRGRNEDLSVKFGLGYDPFYSITYIRPYLFRKENISFYISSEYSNIANKSYQAEALAGSKFDSKFFRITLGAGKRFNIFNRLDFYTSFLLVRSPYQIKGITASGEMYDRIPSISFNFTHDSRDLKQFPDYGVFFNISSFYNGFKVKQVSYQSINADLRYYYPVFGDITGKIRFATRQLYGENIPYYDYAFIGLTERIRGHYTDRLEGKRSYVSSIELKYPIIPLFDIGFNLPLIPKQLQQARTALYISIFFDAGFVRENYEPITWSDIYSGYGVGISIPALPFNLARFEYAFNKFGKGELILDLGISF